MGTGALSRTVTDREADIRVKSDNPSAYLALGPGPDPNGDYVQMRSVGSGKVLEIELNGANTNVTGDGLNAYSENWFDSVFTMKNQSAAQLYVYLTKGNITSKPGLVDFYQGSQRGKSIVGSDNAVKLPVGNQINVGVYADARNLEPGDQIMGNQESFEIRAQNSQP
jgi:hypothetical protein